MNRVWSWGVKRSFGQCLLGLCCSLLASSSGGRLQGGNTALDTKPYLREGFSTNNPLLKRGSDMQYS